MRDLEGLLPQEAFDELLKFLFYKDCIETAATTTFGRPKAPSDESPSVIRETIAKQLSTRAPWALQLWPDGCFNLSDSTLLDLQRIFSNVQLDKISSDIRSTALWTFIDPNVRKSLGIFSTPEDVVRMMIDVVAPTSSDVVLDPACGTGTFLMEYARFISKRDPTGGPLNVYGVDKNPRMLLLADLNLGHMPGVIFKRTCADSLRAFLRTDTALLGLKSNSVDVILTNPPFGVTVTEDTGILDLFDLDEDHVQQKVHKVPSEVLFVQLCFHLLRPGGRLGIVLPRSVITNERIGQKRHAIDQLGHLTEIIDLPPETFVSTGTQTTTVAAFFRKHSLEPGRKTVTVRVCRITNVGYDSTGRRRKGNQLPVLAETLLEKDPSDKQSLTSHFGVDANKTLQLASGFLFRRSGPRKGMPLGNFVEVANTGRTPARSAYTSEGMFILKVGNLTGRGIDWKPRDRNFVSQAEAAKRARSGRLAATVGDILLTSSAHSAYYIAKKVDIVSRIPESYGSVTFVGEVIRVRPISSIDPFILFAALRYESVREDLQACVRGQTAHLNPSDMLKVIVPCNLEKPEPSLIKAADLLREEAELAFRLYSVASAASRLLTSSPTPMV